MLQTLLCLFVLAGNPQAVAPRADGFKADAFKKEGQFIQSLINDAVNSAVPGQALLQEAKSTYLEGFGVVVTLEVALQPPPNPFSNPKTPAELRRIFAERRPAVQKKLEELLKERVTKMESVGPGESLAIVVHLFNSSPPDLPDLPSQFVMIVKKVDPATVVVREFR